MCELAEQVGHALSLASAVMAAHIVYSLNGWLARCLPDEEPSSR